MKIMSFISNMKLNTHLLYACAFLTLALAFSIPLAAQGLEKGPAAGPQKFALSDEEIKAMGLSEKDAAEMKQFFDALNNMSPEQQKELEDLGRKTEEKMKNTGLDPANFDDLVKFMETEGLSKPGAVQKPEMPAPTRPAPFRPDEKGRFEPMPQPTFERPTIVPVTSPVDTLTMLNDIVHTIAAMQQKVTTRPELRAKLLNFRPTLNEFTYYAAIARSPNIVVLLASRDFQRLHSTLTSIHNALKTYEPSIIPRRISHAEEDPYELLDVAYSASPEEIKAAFADKKASEHPKALEKLFKEQGKDKASIKKQIKAARTKFHLVQDAYDTLKSPKLRAQLDKELQEKIDKEQRHERSSARAFDSLMSSLQNALLGQRATQEIRIVLERFKPEEAAQARAQLELEKKAYERSKQIIRVPQAPPRYEPQTSPYDAFYQKMAQESYQRPYYPRFNGAQMQPRFGQQQPQATGAQAGAPAGTADKDKGKKATKKDGTKDSKDAKDATKDGTTAPKEDQRPFKNKDIEIMTSMQQLEGLLKNAADQKDTLKVTMQVPAEEASAAPEPGSTGPGGASSEAPSDDPSGAARSPGLGDTGDTPPTAAGVGHAPGELKKVEREFKLDKAIEDLKPELSGGVTRSAGASEPGVDQGSEAAHVLQGFAETYHLKQVADLLKKIAPGPRKKIEQKKICDTWEKRIFNQYGHMIKTWHDKLYSLLSNIGRQRKGLGTVNAQRAELYQLGPEKVDLWAKDKKDKKPAAPTRSEGAGKPKAGINLGEIRDTIKAIHEYYTNINDACGLKKPAPSKAIAAKDDKDDDDDDDKSDKSK